MNDAFAAREPMAQPPPPVRPAPYEFTAPQEALIASLARLMRLVGGASMGFGAILTLAAFAGAGNVLMVIIQSGLMILIGALTWNVAGRFAQIPRTEGRDIQHLLDALSGLRTIYLVQVWALGLAVLLLAAVMVWVMILLASR